MSMSSHPEIIEAAMLWRRELILQVHMPAHVAFFTLAPLVERFSHSEHWHRMEGSLPQLWMI